MNKGTKEETFTDFYRVLVIIIKDFSFFFCLVFKGGPGAVSSNAVLNKSKSNHQMSMHLFLPAVFITCFLQATYECHYNQQQRVGSR